MSGPVTVSFAAYGSAPVTVSGAEDVMADLARLWSPFVSEPTHPEASVAVPDVAAASAEVNRALVARTPFPAVHAGVVAVEAGAIAFPAVSGAGKSTLTAVLCLQGARYLSDEALVIDDSGAGAPSALPYPKPVALSPWSAAAVGLGSCPSLDGDLLEDGTRELLFAPDRLGEVSPAVSVAHLLLPGRAAGAPRLEPVHRMQGLAALVRLSFNHYVDPRRFLLAAAGVVTGAEVWQLQVGEPVETARLVLDRLG